MPNSTTTKRAPDVQAARNAIRIKGWSQRAVAAQLGVSREHLNYVLNGRRRSKRLLDGILRLPINREPA